jgi:hypothetical protein
MYDAIDEDPPVTVCILRQARRGREQELEQIIMGITAAAMRFPGHLGTTIFRPSDPDDREYRIIFKFDRLSNLRAWEASEVRHRWLELANPLIEGRDRVQVVTGLETWFTLPKGHGLTPPPRHKMVIASFLAIFPLVKFTALLVTPLFSPLPPLLADVLSSIFVCIVMTYVAMPQMTRLLAPWLYPGAKR